MSGSLRPITGLVAVTFTVLATAAAAAPPSGPPDDRLLPAEQHQTEKARALATRHAGALRALNSEIYHCMPWVEVQKASIGFYKPRNATADDRYLSIRIYIEQEPSSGFARLTTEQRAAAMFSRYVGPLLVRMTRDPGVRNDDTIDGFTMVLEWLKQAAGAGQRPVHETIAVFVDKVDADDYLGGRMGIQTLATRTRVLGFDGETPLGALHLAAWDDNFVATYRVKNYQVEPGITCPTS